MLPGVIALCQILSGSSTDGTNSTQVNYARHSRDDVRISDKSFNIN